MTVPTRSLSRGFAQLVAELELRQPTLITLEELAQLADDAQLKTQPKTIALRLRHAGWLLPTAQRGVYEFAPGAHAGPYGHGDPFIDLRAVLLTGQQPGVLALHSALWLHGMTDRPPDRHEVAFPIGAKVPAAVKHHMRVVHFSGRLPPADIRELAVHRPPTIMIHLANKPGDVRGWTTFGQALPGLAARCSLDELEQELENRPSTVRPKLAYLISGVAPQIAERLQPTQPSKLTWFGATRTSVRFDKRFNVADGLLPFDPRTRIDIT